MKTKPTVLLGALLYSVALGAMFLPSMAGQHRTPVEIPTVSGRTNPATIWQGATPRAVMLVGHGVTSNQGIMAMLAKSFAQNGYVAVAFDFWGHGRSRERFDWSANPDQIHAVVAWARREYPGLPLGYLGHSMGGFAGSDAFNESPAVDAFVSLGALPRKVPACKTAVAAGIFEELFTLEKARERMGDQADVISSPFSNHASETSDPLLIIRIVGWVNNAFGLEGPVVFPWVTWVLSLLATILGCAGILILASALTGLLSADGGDVTPQASKRKWSVNPYRLAGLLAGARGVSSPPRSSNIFSAFLRGMLFAGVVVVLLSFLLDIHIFTVRLSHPERLLTWLILTPLLGVLVFFDSWVLERVPLTNARVRFAVAALTRAVPLLTLALAARLLYPGLAFGSMMLGIYAFILVMLALVHALTTRAASDWRAGATAAAMLFAWVIAFWFPLYWPWV